jgi:hypothetical protein
LVISKKPLGLYQKIRKKTEKLQGPEGEIQGFPHARGVFIEFYGFYVIVFIATRKKACYPVFTGFLWILRRKDAG